MNRILVYGMTDNRGGIESYLMNYFRVISKNGNMIFDFVTEYREIAYQDEVQKLGGKVYHIPSRRENLIAHIRGIREILKKHPEYQKIYFNILSASETFSVVGAVGVKGVEKIIHSHNNSVKSIVRHRCLRPILNLLADKRFACSIPAAEFMFGRKYVNKGTYIIKNAINTEKYKYDVQKRLHKREELKIFNEFVVGHVGRLCYQKNTLFLIDIFKVIHEVDSNAKLLIVGKGEDRSLVEDRIKKHNLQQHVIMAGERNDVAELMQAMDVFVLPSRFEGLPVVSIEAQVSGLPCVFADTFTKEADVSGAVEFCSLEKGAKYWAERILSYHNSERINSLERVVKSGFDIFHEAEKLEALLT